MAYQITESCFLASIYPDELWVINKPFGHKAQVNSPRNTIYKLKPVKLNQEPYVLEIHDGFQNIHDPSKTTARGESPWSSKIVDCHEIRENLLQEWNGAWFDAPPGSGLGIIAIEGKIPTEEEVERMRLMQTTFAEWCYQRGEKANRENKWKEIRKVDRVLSKWIGKDANWISPESISAYVPCPHCRERVAPEATVCKTCGRDMCPTSDSDDAQPVKRGPGRPRREVLA